MSTAGRRRNVELRLGLVAVIITTFGYLLVQLADKPNLPPDLWLFLAVMIVLYVVAHYAVRRLAPLADPVLLPVVAFLNGVGFVTISRLDRDLARARPARPVTWVSNWNVRSAARGSPCARPRSASTTPTSDRPGKLCPLATS